MNKKIAVGGSYLVIVIAIALGVYYHNTQINAMKAELKNSESRLVESNGYSSALSSENTDLQKQKADLESQKQSLQKEKEQLESDKKKIQYEKSVLENKAAIFAGSYIVQADAFEALDKVIYNVDSQDRALMDYLYKNGSFSNLSEVNGYVDGWTSQHKNNYNQYMIIKSGLLNVLKDLGSELEKIK